MAIIASARSTSFEAIPEGVYTAVCVWVIDLGEQYSAKYEKYARKVMLTWEIPEETILVNGEEKPRVISKEYTMSLSEKAVLRQHLEAWRGKKFTEQELGGFDLGNILGKSCQIQVLHNDRGFANVGSLMAMPKGREGLQAVNEQIYFDLSDKGCLGLLDKLPPWILDKVKQSSTYTTLVAANVDTDGGDFQDAEEQDLPFWRGT